MTTIFPLRKVEPYFEHETSEHVFEIREMFLEGIQNGNGNPSMN